MQEICSMHKNAQEEEEILGYYYVSTWLGYNTQFFNEPLI